MVFGRELDAEGQQYLRGLPDGRTPSFFWRLDPTLARLAPGYVWEIDGRLVGNVTLLPTRSGRRYLVANVAVHPDFRRRGIARMLMIAAEEDVRQHQGSEIILQVDRDNEAGLRLYHSLGYDACGSMTTWRSSVSRVRNLPLEMLNDKPLAAPRKLQRGLWQEAFQLDQSALASELRWPEPLQSDFYKRGFWKQASDFLNGRFQHCWMTVDPQRNLNGLATICGEWGRSHQLHLRVLPQWKGQLEGVLLQKLIDGLRSLPRRNVQLVHLTDDHLVSRLLTQANFSQQRTLTHMRLKIDY
jgi:GNAT superfamily N-acetyltransferase